MDRMVQASDLLHDGAQRLGAIAGEVSGRIQNVSAPTDGGDALGRSEPQRSNEFPDRTTDQDEWAERHAARTAGEPSTGTSDPRQV